MAKADLVICQKLGEANTDQDHLLKHAGFGSFQIMIYNVKNCVELVMYWA